MKLGRVSSSGLRSPLSDLGSGGRPDRAEFIITLVNVQIYYLQNVAIGITSFKKVVNLLDNVVS